MTNQSSASIIAMAFVWLACAGSASAADKGLPSTIVWMEPTCAVSKAGASGLPTRQEIAPIVAAVISALVPALVNKSIDFAAANLEARANDKDRKVKGSYGDSFYQLGTDRVLLPGERIGCLSLAHGTFPRTTSANEPLFTGHLRGLSEDLKERGITAQPDLYVETSIEFSTDGTAFRLLPQTVIYTKSLRGAKSGDFRGLALIAAFRRPLAKQDGETFAVGSIALPGLRPGNDYLSGSLGANTNWWPRSNWMPLPAVDAELKTALTAHTHNIAAREESRRKVTALLQETASDGKQFKLHEAVLAADKTALCPYGGEKADRTKYEAWRQVVADKLDAQRRQKEKLSRAAGTPPKPAAANKLADLDTVVNILNDCLAAEIADDAVRADQERLAKVAPFDVELTAVETFEPSKFLGFAAGVLTGGKEALATGLTAQIDPTKRTEAAEAEEKARLDAESQARELWTTAKKAELDLGTAKNDIDLAKAMLDLDLAKRKANRAYAALKWALPFPETGQ